MLLLFTQCISIQTFANQCNLFFAIMTTAYILIAIQLEERDLMREHPEYAAYRARVPMLIPFLRRRGRSEPPGVGAAAQH